MSETNKEMNNNAEVSNKEINNKEANKELNNNRESNNRENNNKENNNRESNNRESNNRENNNRENNNRENNNRENNNKENNNKENNNKDNNKKYNNGRGGAPRDNKQKNKKIVFAHKGMVYISKETGTVHDWNCSVLKNANLQEFEEKKEVPLLTGAICDQCGRSLLFKKYTEDKDEGRALARFLNDKEISNEFLCEMYEVYHIYPYVYNGALKITYNDENWKIIKNENKLVVYHNDFGENMPGWFNDYWNVYQEVEGNNLEEVIKSILSK